MKSLHVNVKGELIQPKKKATQNKDAISIAKKKELDDKKKIQELTKKQVNNEFNNFLQRTKSDTKLTTGFTTQHKNDEGVNAGKDSTPEENEDKQKNSCVLCAGMNGKNFC